VNFNIIYQPLISYSAFIIRYLSKSGPIPKSISLYSCKKICIDVLRLSLVNLYIPDVFPQSAGAVCIALELFVITYSSEKYVKDNTSPNWRVPFLYR
jgi:hypothetical protein